MRISVEASALKAALARVAKIIQPRNTIPVLATVKVSAGESGITISATDLTMWAEVDVDGKVLSPGSACIPATEMARFASLAKRGDVTIGVTDEIATIEFGRSSAQLHTFPAADFPMSEFGRDLPRVDGGKLAAALRFCIPAAGTDETRYFLCGVYIDNSGPSTALVATDGHRIHVAEMDARIDGGAIVPTAAAQMIADIAAGEIGFRVGGTTWDAEAEGCRLRGKLVDGAFPDWRRIGARRTDAPAHVAADDLIAAAEVALVGTEDRKTSGLVLEASQNGLTVSGAKGGGSVAKPGSRTIDMGGEAEFRAGINGRYLAASVSACGCETVRLVVPQTADTVDMEPEVPPEGLNLFVRIMAIRIAVMMAEAA